MLEFSVFRSIMFRFKTVLVALFGSLFFLQASYAQVDQSSYSAFGVGTLNWSGYAQNNAMGGLGISNSSRFFFNDLNPALVGINREAVFQLGTSLDYRSISNGQASYSSMTGGFKEFGVVVPMVYSRWNVGLSINPYSSVNYGFLQEKAGPDGSSTVVDVSGRGGIDLVNMSTSLRFGNFHLGLKGMYYYGNISTEDKFILNQVNTNFGTTVVNERRSFGKLGASVGLLYKMPIGEDKSLNIGAYYNPGVDLRQTTLVTFVNEASNGSISSQDTLVYDKEDKRSITIPERLGFGITYEKLNNVTIGVDVQLQDWSQYRNEQGLSENHYGNSLRIAFGADFIPNYSQPTKLLNVMIFRFGVHYEKTPFMINDQTINDLGINFGVSLPLNSFWGMSHLNMGLTLGQQGNISTVGLVRENYLKLNLGFSLQDLTWFTKQRFN